ncbi:MAG: iron-siderophore ABC transporter substrate-binding protein, partial [Aeromonas veronii]
MAPCLISLLLPLAAQADTYPIVSAPLPRIATVDWTIAETLLALGVTPLAVGDAGPSQAWVGEPRLPTEVVDIGLRTQPNRKLLAELRP